MRMLGRRSLGLAYGLVATDLVLAPAIPSNTARAGGVIYPILRSLCVSLDSTVEQGTERRIAAFLTFTVYQGVVVTSAMFLTAMAANPLVVELAAQQGVEISWGLWAAAASVPGLLSLLSVPLLIYRLYPPQITDTPAAPELARRRLGELGAMTRHERILLAVFVLLLSLWIAGTALGISATTTALAGVAAMLVTGVLAWEDILRERSGWDTLIWFAVLVMLASQLGELGLLAWFTERVSGVLAVGHWIPAFLGLSLIYFYVHYFFASNTAHVSVMYAPFLALAIAVGTPRAARRAPARLLQQPVRVADALRNGGGADPVRIGQCRHRDVVEAGPARQRREHRHLGGRRQPLVAPARALVSRRSPGAVSGAGRRCRPPVGRPPSRARAGVRAGGSSARPSRAPAAAVT